MADSNTCGQDPPLPKDPSCGKSANHIDGDYRYLLLMGFPDGLRYGRGPSGEGGHYGAA
jgi:hypothetical protein